MIFNLVTLDNIEDCESTNILANSLIVFNNSETILYFDLGLIRYDLTGRVSFIDDIENIDSPAPDHVYVCPDGSVYKCGMDFKITSIEDAGEIFDIFKNEEYRIVTLTIPEGIAPVTTYNQIKFDNTKESLDSLLARGLKDDVTKQQAEAEYAEGLWEGQTSVQIPYPTENYDIKRNFMFVLRGGVVLDGTTDYYLDDNGNIVLKEGLHLNEKLLFIFCYIANIDPSASLVIGIPNLDNELALKIDTAYRHTKNTNNPHMTTKEHVGLGLVNNFGIATDKEALAGISNEAYMTPAKTNLLIRSLKAEGFIPSDDYVLSKQLYIFHAETTNVTAFSLSEEFYNPLLDTLQLYYKGLRLYETINYTKSANTINLKFDIEADEDIVVESVRIIPNLSEAAMRMARATYTWTSTENNMNIIEIPSEFMTSSKVEVELFYNGHRYREGVDYIKNGTAIILDNDIPVGEKIYCDIYTIGTAGSSAEDTFDSDSRENALSAYRGKLLYEMIRCGYDYLCHLPNMKVVTPSLLDLTTSEVYDATTNTKIADKSSRDDNGNTVITTKFYKDNGEVEYATEERIVFDPISKNYTVTTTKL